MKSKMVVIMMCLLTSSFVFGAKMIIKTSTGTQEVDCDKNPSMCGECRNGKITSSNGGGTFDCKIVETVINAGPGGVSVGGLQPIAGGVRPVSVQPSAVRPVRAQPFRALPSRAQPSVQRAR